MRRSTRPVGRGGEVPQAAPAAPAAPSWLLRWALYGFIFSLPFDAPGKFPLELTTMTGAVFVAVTMLFPGRCYGRRPAALWWFAGYLYAYWLAYVLGGGQHTADAIKSFLFYLQGLLIFCAAFNLMRDERTTRAVLFTLVAAAAVLALMTILGIGKAMDSETLRATVFGQNANRAARVLCAGALAAVGLVYGRARKGIRPGWLGWALAAIIGLAMIMGGSRGGLIAMAAGLWMFSLTGATFGIRIRNTVVAMVAIALAVWGALQSPLMQRRMEMAMQGNLAKREVIFPAAFQMFRDHPLYGWGPSNQFVLATRLRLPPALHLSRDTHNLFLELLTATGLLGTIPFLAGLWLCVRGAWRARRGTEGILPAAQMAALLIGNLSGNYIALKLQWVLLAYALASFRHLTPHVRRPNVSPTIAARRARWG
jgi:O-antigen ligase